MPDGSMFQMKQNPVRLATREDEEPLYALLYKLYVDNDMGVPVDWDKVRTHIRAGTERTLGMIGIIEHDSKIVGSIGLFFSQLWYSSEWSLYERWLFVDPAYRRYGYARALFDFAEQQRLRMQDQLGHRFLLWTGCHSFKNLSSKMKLWGRFARLAGGAFVMGLGGNK